MLCVLKATVLKEEIVQEFTWHEKDTAIAIGRIWHRNGWNPRLLVKSWDGRFFWLTSQLGQREAKAA